MVFSGKEKVITLAALKHFEKAIRAGEDLSHLSDLIDTNQVTLKQVSELCKSLEASISTESAEVIANFEERSDTPRPMLDENVVSAIKLWYSHGINPGAFSMSLLEGNYEDALERAHELLKPHFDDHVSYVQSLPMAGRGSNISNFKGGISLPER